VNGLGGRQVRSRMSTPAAMHEDQSIVVAMLVCESILPFIGFATP